MSQGQSLRRRGNNSIEEKEKLREELKKGYSQMAELNLKLARKDFEADREAYRSILFLN